MEEHKNHNKVSRLIIVLVIAITVIIAIIAYLMYLQKIDADKQIAALKESEANLQATVAELQGKLGNISDIASTDVSDTKINENQYSIYEENFEKNYKTVLGSTVEGEYVADQFDGESFDRVIRVDKDGNAYYDDKKIDSNVAYVRFCRTGQDGGDAILIHRDGTVSVIKEFGFPDKKVEVSVIDNVKNIVNVISVVESGVNDIDGGWTYYFVDINGNIINK